MLMNESYSSSSLRYKQKQPQSLPAWTSSSEASMPPESPPPTNTGSIEHRGNYGYTYVSTDGANTSQPHYQTQD